MANRNSLDDLIGSSTQPIIVQDSGGDKKFLYILIILLVILFIIALGAIAFISGKYYGGSSNLTEQNNITEQTLQQNSTKRASMALRGDIEQVKSNNTSGNVSELEKLAQEQRQLKDTNAQKAEQKNSPTQRAITKVASVATGGKTLSQEELAKIAQLVAQELAKSKVVNSSANQQKSTNRDDALMASLQSAQTDTLENNNIDTAKLKDSKVNSSAKKVDTFNKVVVKEQTDGDDEIAKLSSEIDSILQSEEVTKKERSLKYRKELQKEIASRQKGLRFIVVKKGDTLSSLAYKAYGRASAYSKIYEANPDLVKNPNKIYEGMKLRVPVDEEYLKQQGN